MILFTDIRGDTRAIVGYDDQSVINNLISQYDEDKEEFTLLWEGVDLRLYSLIPLLRKRYLQPVKNKRINFCLDGSNPSGQKFCCIHS